MKNVFIDLGSFYGSIINKFMRSPLYSPNFEIHAFEANPLFQGQQFVGYPPKTKIHRVAAWVYDGELDLFLNRDKKVNVQGTSVFREKRTGDLDPENPARVRCIDFDRWLRDNFDPSDNIIVKSNIEGAEYPLFEHLIRCGSVAYIKRLFLRTHWNKIGMAEADHCLFMEAIRKAVPSVDTEYNFV